MINVSLGMLQPTYLNRREPIIFSVPIPIFTVLVIRDRLNQQSFLTFSFFVAATIFVPSQPPWGVRRKQNKEYIFLKKSIQSNLDVFFCVCAVFVCLGTRPSLISLPTSRRINLRSFRSYSKHLLEMTLFDPLSCWIDYTFSYTQEEDVIRISVWAPSKKG